jgi:type IX secretion system PorP/SprF family membrane protein
MPIGKYIALLTLFLALQFSARSQDIVFSQFYANPLYLNPALAGSKLKNRITLNYRNEWPRIKNGYVTYSATWDQQYDKMHGALGVIANASVQGGGIYNANSIHGIYSYRLQASRYMVLNAAFQVGYFQYKLDWNKLLFGDQIDLRAGNREETREYLPPKLYIGNIDFSTGILGGYKESFYFGVTVNHLSRPDIAFYNDNINRMRLRLTIHSGILIDFVQGMDGEDLRNFSISPNVVYVQQGKFHQLNAGIYLNTYPIVAGLWLRHNFENPDAVIVLLGLQQKKFKIGYSFDYTISQLSMASGGAHEISIAFQIPKYLDPDRYHKMRGEPVF